MTLVNARTKGKRTDLLEKMSNLFINSEPIARMMKIESEWLEEIKEKQKKYTTNKRILSFTDASNIYVCDREKITNIVSFDENFEGIITTIN